MHDHLPFISNIFSILVEFVQKKGYYAECINAVGILISKFLIFDDDAVTSIILCSIHIYAADCLNTLGVLISKLFYY